MKIESKNKKQKIKSEIYCIFVLSKLQFYAVLLVPLCFALLWYWMWHTVDLKHFAKCIKHLILLSVHNGPSSLSHSRSIKSQIRTFQRIDWHVAYFDLTIPSQEPTFHCQQSLVIWGYSKINFCKTKWKIRQKYTKLKLFSTKKN